MDDPFELLRNTIVATVQPYTEYVNNSSSFLVQRSRSLDIYRCASSVSFLSPPRITPVSMFPVSLAHCILASTMCAVYAILCVQRILYVYKYYIQLHTKNDEPQSPA